MTDANGPEPLSFACALDHPPEKVWRALTVPDIVAAWLAPNDLEAREGARCTLNGAGEGGRDIACEVIEAEPNRLLRYRWSEADGDSGAIVRSVVTFTLEKSRGGTLLRVTHDEFSRARIAARDARPIRTTAQNRSRTRLSAAPARRQPLGKPTMRMAA